MKVQLICIFVVAAAAVAVSAPNNDFVSAAVGSAEGCNVCIYEFTQILKNDKLEWIASLVVPLICSLAGPVGPKCTTFLDHWVDVAINMTISLGPEGVCERLKACNKTSVMEAIARVPTMELQRRTLERRTVGATPQENCNVCKYEFQQILAKDKLQWISTLVVPLACSVTGPVAPKCEAFLNKYVNEFINMTIALGPEGICEDLGSCPKPTSNPPITKPAFLDLAADTTTFNPGCTGCHLGMDYLEAFLGSQAALKEFKKLMDQGACVKMPPVLQQLCNTLTDTILPLIITSLQNALQDADVCAAVCIPTTVAP